MQGKGRANIEEGAQTRIDGKLNGMDKNLQVKDTLRGFHIEMYIFWKFSGHTTTFNRHNTN